MKTKKYPPKPPRFSPEQKVELRLANAELIKTNKWAVFASEPNIKKCRFTVLYPTKDEAIEAARTLAIRVFAEEGKRDYSFMVVRVEHEVGWRNGKPIENDIA